ncbi:hypothetical protein D172_010690 [Pseudoalteromonas sp. Bsw20308]|uniref:hypothetical protein n=1 Tax=unclassified Pseudoalteromonas TaxID=194690 RepID=UPI0002315791|nr:MULTISPECIES: hypothetical protein [unclassified Pseudoalteromonas]ALQ08491.1 hypothetical protein D172_010690 [Pseudoalteromonas sp. Bsw20308]GAA79264.1 hypothetical protein P20495_1762 [Pseudoalteromonas sp. BSi20495]
MDAEQQIQNAIDTKQKINVIYNGGSMSGQSRVLGPISIKGNKVRAKCYTTNALKTFLIERIQVMAENGELTKDRSSEVNQPPKVEPQQTLLDIKNAIAPHFPVEQWLIDLTESTKDLSIYERFKNGNPKKLPELQVCFEEYRTELEIDELTGDFKEVIIKRTKNWVVRYKRKKSAISYSHLNTAADRLFTWCKELLGNQSIEFKFLESAMLKHLKTMWPSGDKNKIKRELAAYPSVYYNSAISQGTLNNENWYFSVPYTFRDALDIKYEERKKDKKGYMVWTQGPILKFKMGDNFPSKNSNITIQVQFGDQMGWDGDKSEMYLGSVVFDLFELINKKYIYKQRYQCNQMEFLELLINGGSLDRLTKLSRSLINT